MLRKVSSFSNISKIVIEYCFNLPTRYLLEYFYVSPLLSIKSIKISINRLLLGFAVRLTTEYWCFGLKIPIGQYCEAELSIEANAAINISDAYIEIYGIENFIPIERFDLSLASDGSMRISADKNHPYCNHVSGDTEIYYVKIGKYLTIEPEEEWRKIIKQDLIIMDATTCLYRSNCGLLNEEKCKVKFEKLA